MTPNKSDSEKGGVKSEPPLGGEIPPDIALEYLAMNIVFQIGDALYEALPKDVAHEHFVGARQATNDVAIDFAKKLIAAHTQAVVEEIISDDEYPAPGVRVLTLSKKHRNNLRAEMRQRLAQYLGRES